MEFRIVCAYTTFTRTYGLQLLVEEKLLCKMEPNNIKDNYAVCVQKDGVIAKINFYFLRGHTDSKCEVIITGKRFSLSERTNAYAY